MKCNQYTKNRSPWRPTIRGISCESPEYDKHIVHIQLPHNFISFLLWWGHCLATQGTAVKKWQVNGTENIYKYASELASFPGCAHVAWEWGYTDVDQWKHGISLIRRCGYKFFFFFAARFCVATIQGQRLIPRKASRHQRWLDKVCTSDAVVSVKHCQ